ncbi:hypothetical protein ACOME3_005408 [Neoechinorhynchus agilis]
MLNPIGAKDPITSIPIDPRLIYGLIAGLTFIALLLFSLLIYKCVFKRLSTTKKNRMANNDNYKKSYEKNVKKGQPIIVHNHISSHSLKSSNNCESINSSVEVLHADRSINMNYVEHEINKEKMKKAFLEEVNGGQVSEMIRRFETLQ